jgi:hypothetical protein
MHSMLTEQAMQPACLSPEQVVAGTNTGKSPQLASYYAFWERAIFNALNAMVGMLLYFCCGVGMTAQLRSMLRQHSIFPTKC